jgi:hypothetical protein
MSHQASVPAVALGYFGPECDHWRTHPIIAETFRPGIGWRRYPWKKRISLNEARKLRKAGVTEVALSALGRRADFRIQELTR